MAQSLESSTETYLFYLVNLDNILTKIQNSTRYGINFNTNSNLTNTMINLNYFLYIKLYFFKLLFSIIILYSLDYNDDIHVLDIFKNIYEVK